jgi:hypothetical protein
VVATARRHVLKIPEDPMEVTEAHFDEATEEMIEQIQECRSFTELRDKFTVPILMGLGPMLTSVHRPARGQEQHNHNVDTWAVKASCDQIKAVLKRKHELMDIAEKQIREVEGKMERADVPDDPGVN